MTIKSNESQITLNKDGVLLISLDGSATPTDAVEGVLMNAMGGKWEDIRVFFHLYALSTKTLPDMTEEKRATTFRDMVLQWDSWAENMEGWTSLVTTPALFIESLIKRCLERKPEHLATGVEFNGVAILQFTNHPDLQDQEEEEEDEMQDEVQEEPAPAAAETADIPELEEDDTPPPTATKPEPVGASTLPYAGWDL